MKVEMNLSKFEQYWGPGKLTRWDDLVLRDVAMPSASKTFLIDVGLPSPGRDIHGWQFEWNLALPLFSRDRRKLRLLGSNRGFTPVLIDETRNGCVVWNAAEGQYERFINTSVEQFATSLIVLDKHYLRALEAVNQPYDVKAVARALTALEGSLNDIDDAALVDRNSLWSTIVQDIRREIS